MRTTTNNLANWLQLILFCLLANNLSAQEKPIFLENASFEGDVATSAYVEGWDACQAEGVPRKVNDPALMPGPFGVELNPIDGDTYLGLVTRDNNTWESITQELSSPMTPDWCYLFQVALAQSPVFLNFSTLQNKQVYFNTPITLKIWGGDDNCDKTELLAQTTAVDHAEWDGYSFYLCPTEEHTHLTLEAYYVDDNGMSFPNGHLLLDDASPLYPLPYSYGEIDWEKVPTSSYLTLEDSEELEELLLDYGQKIKFDKSVLPYQIYLDAAQGLRYGNLYFDTIASALGEFSDEQLIIAILPDTEGETKDRIIELKNVLREIGIQNYQYKIKSLDKLADETDWLVETPFLKMKLRE